MDCLDTSWSSSVIAFYISSLLGIAQVSLFFSPAKSVLRYALQNSTRLSPLSHKKKRRILPSSTLSQFDKLSRKEIIVNSSGSSAPLPRWERI